MAAARAALDAAGVPVAAAVLAAVSGGPDSTALLAALAELRAEGRLSLAACIVDHGIRDPGQVEGDIAFVQGLCISLEVPLHIARLPPGECRTRTRASRGSLEDVAREARLRELASCARQIGAVVVALGHTEDDSIETILMGVIRGSDAAGLRGILPVRGLFVRPLLLCTRAEVLAYLAGRNLGFRTDPTNADPAMLRNRVRRELLPVLERDFPGYRTGLAMLARKSALTDDLVRAAAGSIPWRRTGQGFSLPADIFFLLPAAVRSLSLMTLWDRLAPAGSPRRLPFRFLLPSLSAAPPAADGTILAGHGARLSIAAGILSWEADIVTRGKKSYLIEANRNGRFEVRSAGITMEIRRRLRGAAPDPAHPRFDAMVLERAIVPPIVLRSRRAGDRVRLEQGTKTLKALFGEWKVPLGDRWKVPILADRNGVLAVLGSPVGRRTLVRWGMETAEAADAVLGVRAEVQEGTSEQQF